METSAEDHQLAVERMQHCRAHLVGVVPVSETFRAIRYDKALRMSLTSLVTPPRFAAIHGRHP
jgi:hypothetical protein